MPKRIAIPFLMMALAIIAFLSFLFILAPIQAAPDKANTPHSDSDLEHFAAFLTGDQEVPAVGTNASGVARFSLDGTTLAYEVAVRDIADITASHIHMGAPGVNGPVVYPLFTGAGDFDPGSPISGTLMLTEDQANDLRAGNYYVNVHTVGYPAGEIRGQIGQPSLENHSIYLPFVMRN